MLTNLFSTAISTLVNPKALVFWITLMLSAYSQSGAYQMINYPQSNNQNTILYKLTINKEGIRMPKNKKPRKKISRKQVSDAWSDSLEVNLLDGTTIKAVSVEKKTPCHCPFHDDDKHSAFVAYSKKSMNHFISCSSEHATYWKEKDANRYAKFSDNYWSYGTDYFEFGFANDKFFYNKIGIKKIYYLANAETTEDKNELASYLVKNKHIKHISNIEYLGDHSINVPTYSVDQVQGIVSVHHPMLPVNINDNTFIEDYLTSTFGSHKDFIKQWMAVYSYTNYRKLPTLIFTGPRGTGKSTFAELLMEIYKPISTDWEGVSKDFGYEFENKLLVVEENDRDTTDQYKIFKTITGQREKTVNKKFKDPYRIKNNANLILLSNEPIPMYVKKEELPTDPKNNQFFVYEFKPLNTLIDAQLFQKLVDRLGYYCRTELLTVFNNLFLDDKRYSIEVPVTAAEKALFESNVTEIDSEVNELIDYLNCKVTDVDGSDYKFLPFIEKGFLPSKIIRHFGSSKSHYQSKVKNLTKRGYIEPTQSKRMIDTVRESGYVMTQKMIDAINNTDIEEINFPDDDNEDENAAACVVAV